MILIRKCTERCAVCITFPWGFAPSTAPPCWRLYQSPKHHLHTFHCPGKPHQSFTFLSSNADQRLTNASHSHLPLGFESLTNTSHSHLLGLLGFEVPRFHLDGIPPAPRGVPQIEALVGHTERAGTRTRTPKAEKRKSERIEGHRGFGLFVTPQDPASSGVFVPPMNPHTFTSLLSPATGSPALVTIFSPSPKLPRTTKRIPSIDCTSPGSPSAPGDLRHRCQRHPQRVRPGQVHRQALGLSYWAG